ncbi:4-demethylwyosine synthase TYW1 [Candidatus Woesearchaeota archaeon]|nr:4-demethylwyosine synthase TYW1 [Candidatus Woesearchaeota archaeon]
MLSPRQKAKANLQQYRLVGRHSAVKICHWTKECIRKGRVCYKQDFYGIHTGNCLEMTPAITCNHRCLHCWRDTSLFSTKWEGEADEPQDLIKGCIDGRRELLIGFGGRENVKADKQFQEAFAKYLIPDHAAISLTGEPCLYPKLPLLIDSFYDDFGFRSVFLVTNGTVPEMLKRLRITAIKGENMAHAKEFLPFIQLMEPQFIEVKGYGFLGMSRRRLTESNVPNWEEVQQFAEELAELSGYKVGAKHEASDIVQLSDIVQIRFSRSYLKKTKPSWR